MSVNYKTATCGLIALLFVSLWGAYANTSEPVKNPFSGTLGRDPSRHSGQQTDASGHKPRLLADMDNDLLNPAEKYLPPHISPVQLSLKERAAFEGNLPVTPQMPTQATALDPIFVNGDSDLVYLKQKLGLPGTGTMFDPISISGFLLRHNDTFVPLMMINTRLYVQISGNVIQDTYHSWYYEAGVWLRNVSNVLITSNTIQNNTEFGVRIESSSNVNVTQNSLLWNTMGAVLIQSSTSVLVANNTVRMNRIYGTRSVSPVIYDADISVEQSTNSTISGNLMEQSAADHSVYITNSQGIGIIGNNIVNSSYSGISGARITIDSYMANISISDNVISSNNGPGIETLGIYGFNLGPTVIRNNTVSKNLGDGISIYQSHENHIVNNNVFNNTGDGISGFTNISRSDISENVVNYNNGSGIVVSGYSLMEERSSIRIADNHVEGNSGDGVLLSLIDQVDLFSNLISNNLGNGILVDGSSNNSFAFDKVIGNNKSGIVQDLVTYWSDRSDDNSYLDVYTSGNTEHGFLSTSAASRTILNNITSVNNLRDGVRLWFSGNTTIQGFSKISHNEGDGIYVMYADFTTIQHADVNFNDRGIYIYQSNNVFIYSVHTDSNTLTGIHAYGADSLVMNYVSSLENSEGIKIFSSSGLDATVLELNNFELDLYLSNVNDSTVFGSTFQSDLVGLSVAKGSTNVNVTLNDFVNSSIAIKGNRTDSLYIRENEFQNIGTVYRSLNSSYGDFSDNVVKNSFIAVDLTGASDIQVSNNTIEVNYLGILLTGTQSVYVDRNQIYGGDIGIDVDVKASSLTIVDNTVHNTSRYGILIEGHTPTPDEKNMLTSNTFHHSGVGIKLTGAMYWDIGDNLVHDNSVIGIYVLESSSIKLYSNFIHSNQYGGVTIQGQKSFENELTNNTIVNHYFSLGLNLNGSAQNTLITQNIFAGNGILSSSQANDNGVNNIFSGNYWDDAVPFGSDSDSDGYFDQSYDIQGTANNLDGHPLVTPPSFNLEGHLLTTPAFVGFPPIPAEVSGKTTVGWRPSFDSQYHSVTFSLSFSSDNGKTWSLLLSGSSPTVEVDFSTLPTGDLNRLKVTASDGSGLSVDYVSEVFKIKQGQNGTSHQLSTPYLQDLPASVQGNVTVTWKEAVDTLGHPVTYSLYYSSDNGATWTLISSTDQTSLVWDTNTVDDGNYILKVEADDGNGLTTSDTSNTFEVSNHQDSTSSSSQEITSRTSSRKESTATRSPILVDWILVIPALLMWRRRRSLIRF